VNFARKCKISLNVYFWAFIYLLTSYPSLSMVKIRTPANVPIIEAGVFGENEKQVKIDITKKYILAALVN